MNLHEKVMEGIRTHNPDAVEFVSSVVQRLRIGDLQENEVEYLTRIKNIERKEDES